MQVALGLFPQAAGRRLLSETHLSGLSVHVRVCVCVCAPVCVSVCPSVCMCMPPRDAAPLSSRGPEQTAGVVSRVTLPDEGQVPISDPV